MNDPLLVEIVRDRLEAHSQSSSRLCVAEKVEGEQKWQLVRTMTKQPDSIFQDEPDLFTNMSNRTMKRIMKHHFWQYKRAWNESDWCQYCFDLEKKVLPQANELEADVRNRLTAVIPNYFEAFDAHSAAASLINTPGLYLREFRHYIWHHEDKKPCRQHTGQEPRFPCGMYSLRARDKGFTPAQRQDLRDLECDINLELKAMSRLLDSYLHHRAANAQQKPVLKRLVDKPSPSTATLLCDFKELMTLPILGKTPGEAFYATARMEISCFGCVLSQGLAATADAPQRVRKAYLLIFSDTLDHTCTRANHCIDISLQALGQAADNLSELNIVSDAAGHFRGFESLYHHLVCLPQRHKCIVRTHFGCEKHMKAEADELFGWVELALKRAKGLKCQIKTLADLKWWIDDYCAAMKKRDPTSPQIKVILDAEPKPSYGRRLKVNLPDFFITRTYCISSIPDSSPAYSYGARIYNHMFSSRPVTVELTSSLLEEPVPELEAPYRKGYYGAGKSNWDTSPKPLQPDEATALTRRQNAQTVALPQGADVAYKVQMDDVDMRQEIEKKKARLDRRRQRSAARKQMLQSKISAHLAPALQTDSSSSSSSDSAPSSD